MAPAAASGPSRGVFGSTALLEIAQVLAQFFDVASRRRDSAPPVARAGQMVAIAGLSWRVPEPRVDTLREAVLLVERSGRGIYDALIIATARHANVRLVLSGDFADGESLEGVSIGDPLSAGFDVSH